MMKRIMAFVVMMVSLVATSALTASQQALQTRSLGIAFEAKLQDAQGLAASGTIAVDARYYSTAERKNVDLVYAEHFASVQLDRGFLRLPLFQGVPENGMVLSQELIAAQPELYVDIAMNGMPMVQAWPLHPAMAATRAQKVESAESLRMPFTITASQVPQHDAKTHITTGFLSENRLPNIPAEKITEGTFPSSKIESIPVGKIYEGTFDASVLPSGFNASWFTDGVLNEALIPSESLRAGDIGMRMGSTFDGTDVKMPDGFERSQCTWMISFREIDGIMRDGIDHIHMSTDSDGVVKCQVDYDTDVNPMKYPCYVNYLTLCKK